MLGLPCIQVRIVAPIGTNMPLGRTVGDVITLVAGINSRFAINSLGSYARIKRMILMIRNIETPRACSRFTGLLRAAPTVIGDFPIFVSATNCPHSHRTLSF